MPKKFHHHSDQENILKISDTESMKLTFRCSKQSASPVSWFSIECHKTKLKVIRKIIQKHVNYHRELMRTRALDACKDPKTRMTNSPLVLVLHLIGLESGVSSLNQSKIEVKSEQFLITFDSQMNFPYGLTRKRVPCKLVVEYFNWYLRLCSEPKLVIIYLIYLFSYFV